MGAALFESARHKEAILYLEEAKAIADEINATSHTQNILHDLARCHAALGNHSEAYTLAMSSMVIKDSLFTKAKSDKIQELTAQYENEKKEAAIALLRTENELQTTQLDNESNVKKGLIGGIGFLALIGGLLFNGQRKRLANQRILADKNNEIRATEFNRNLTELELKALRAQMNPHFIFNCMNGINRLILEDENELASRNLTKFSKLIRMILDHSEKKAVSLDQELEMLETYISLEAQRFKGRIDYSISVDPTIDTRNIELPSMILQPFIENAIWHGLMHREGDGGRIDIKIEERDDVLHCTIEDNGVGREKALALKNSSARNHRSMAMKVTEARLALMDKSGLGKLVQIFDLKEKEKASGTRVLVTIPI